MPLRWGILSTANITDKLLDSGTDQEFVAVGSRDAARAEAYAREKGIARAHGSYEELLADPEVDAIYNPLPNALHVEWSIRALEAGKHVLCEKPLSRRPEDVERAFDVAEREGRVLAEAFMWRHHPQVARARELIDGGAIGDLRVIRSHFAFRRRPPATSASRPGSTAAGSWTSAATASAAAARCAGAEPERACGRPRLRRRRRRRRARRDAALPGRRARPLRLRPGLPGRPRCSRPSAPAARSASTDPWHGRERGHRAPRRATAPSSASRPGPPNSYALELADFEAAVRGEREPLLGRDDALGQARTIAALYTSAERNAPCPIG